MPHHWTKITDTTAADPQDDVYQDEATGTVFVLGQAPANQSKSDIAAKYGVAPSDVTFPLKKK